MESTTGRKFLAQADVLIRRGYSVGQQVGEGTYSKVRTVERLSDDKMCAVKIVDLSKVKNDYLKKFMPRELEIIARLKHDNIIRVYEIIKTKNFVFQVMDYAEKGDILHLIQQKTYIPEAECRLIFTDVTKGVQYLHDMNVAHRDLKCENILIFKDNRAAVGDFGFSRMFDIGTKDILCRTFCGSTAYASPELLRGIPYDPKVNDIWSLGIILFTMLCGTMPFDDGNVTRMVDKQLARTFTYPARVHGKITRAAKHLVFTILDPSINRRPTAASILQSDWIKTTV